MKPISSGVLDGAVLDRPCRHRVLLFAGLRPLRQSRHGRDYAKEVTLLIRQPTKTVMPNLQESPVDPQADHNYRSRPRALNSLLAPVRSAWSHIHQGA